MKKGMAYTNIGKFFESYYEFRFVSPDCVETSTTTRLPSKEFAKIKQKAVIVFDYRYHVQNRILSNAIGRVMDNRSGQNFSGLDVCHH